ncbi:MULTISPECIES: hypothetical protein [Streptomyces]|uniref:Uncharacterized protein n=1 Tax=Streptomyces fungicidicus TaxID=68203 RepID=A0ACC7Y471_9ACTN|nr:hypothetical protein [Streptomyces albidoflavus]NUV76655.1 hypothetical protein [Streptomyces fungicidicus]PAX83723.1 hypothetical protein CLM81_20655 [Streptomyces albidoflavus]PAX86912.1 hypothetical protein CLM82_28050 [Streptomyces albidoflavus]PBO15419.1 hypothetical protein CLM83_30100 [Streptomyces albidoflavus]
MKTLVLGRTPARVRAVLATRREDGFAAEDASTDEEARALPASGEFGVLIFGGGVGPESRAAMLRGRLPGPDWAVSLRRPLLRPQHRPLYFS